MSSTRYCNVQRTLKNLEDADITPENIDSIRKLIDHAAAEGIGDTQQTRLIQSLKMLLTKFAPEDFNLESATEDEIKTLVANLNRSDYAEATKAKARASLKKYYKVENGGHEHPAKVDFFSVHKNNKPSTVSREDLFTDEDLKKLYRNLSKVRDRAFVKVLYESAARPGELLEANIGDFTANEQGDFIFLEGKKGTPDRTNQLVRAGRTVREWLIQHPFGGETGDIENPSVPLWVKTQQQRCKECGEIPRRHSDSCNYKPDKQDRLSYQGFRRRFKEACRNAGIPENKSRPYNLRHTRLTEVATFMGYEQLNKFAGWKPGSDRAKVYVHLNNDDVNKAIRDQYGLETGDEEQNSVNCAFCGAENESHHSECRNCGRPLSLKDKTEKEEKQKVLERLEELDQQGILKKLEQLGSMDTEQSNTAVG